MSTPDGGMPKADYAIQPKDVEDGIRRFLAPVISGLHTSRDSFAAAHGEVEAGRGDPGSGWVGGEGNGDVRAASAAFLDVVAAQLGPLSDEQAEMVTSLEEYEAGLRGHIDWIRTTEDRIANRFLEIERDLDEREW
ncbi:MAG: hypothetical protein ACRDSK_09560 [Actinophytocola sp.]|uniref:hypothetical protein n=1 Tax=Actinophytocola sp. TaxID=1872138 RepID=UPI003D6C3015